VRIVNAFLGGDDFTVSVNGPVSTGVVDNVVVRGKVAVNKDFGFGYKYALIVEQAELVKE